MGWLWTSKKRKAELAQQQLLREELSSLKADLERLQVETTDATRQIGEWKSATESITHERDTLKVDSDRALSAERQKHAEITTELSRKQAELGSQLGLQQQQREALEGANSTLTNSLRERDRLIDQLHGSHAAKLQERDTEIDARDRQLHELTLQLETLSRSSSSQISQQEQQISEQTQQIATLTRAHSDLSKQFEAAQATAASRLQELEQQLAHSEAHSTHRADQRSSLLRNLAEIHRLSEVASKSELRAESLKLINPTWQEQTSPVENAPANDVLSQIYAARTTWNMHGEVESA